MTKAEAIAMLKRIQEPEAWEPQINPAFEALDMAIKALEQEPCEMTAEEYRQRMIQAFHNADADELIAVCVLPTEKEFEHLEWLLKKHYKKEPCEDTISRQEAIEALQEKVFHNLSDEFYGTMQVLNELPSAQPYTEAESQNDADDS